MNTGDLRRVLEHRGPFATAHLDTSHDTENADREVELRWRGARDDLAAQGIDGETLAALDEAITGGPPSVGKSGRLLIAAGGEVLLDRQLPGPPALPVTRVGALPYLLPLVESGAGHVPHVAALVNRVGAEVRVVDADGAVLSEHTTEGEDYPLHKVRGGGWSHLHIQHNVEETVKQNARLVADELARLVDRVHARLLVVAGDEQARTALRDSLPPRCLDILVEPAGRREASDGFDEEVASLVAQRWRAERDEVIDRFLAELPGGLAVQGLPETTAALREGNVSAIVISDPTLADAEVWTSTEPRSIALSEEDLRAVGAAEVDRERADVAVPAAALFTGAELVSASSVRGEAVELTDGIGALLRHD